MGSTTDVKRRLYCGRELRKWSCLGPCMISSGIPLLVPGVTLTCVALASNTGVESFTGLHVTGFIFLAIAIFLICVGCVFYNVFRIKVGPEPIVLLSQADLRMSHSQRMYYNNKPTFEIRENPVSPSASISVENEVKHGKHHRRTSKPSETSGRFTKRRDENEASKRQSVKNHVKDKSEPSSTSKEESDSDETSSETDSEEYTSSSYSSSETSSGTSAQSVNTKPEVAKTNNIRAVPAPAIVTESLIAKNHVHNHVHDHHVKFDVPKMPSEDVKTDVVKVTESKPKAWSSLNGNVSKSHSNQPKSASTSEEREEEEEEGDDDADQREGQSHQVTSPDHHVPVRFK